MLMKKIALVSIVSVLLVACDNEPVVSEPKQVVSKAVEAPQVEVVEKAGVKPAVKLSKVAQINQEIQRIEAIMKTKPTVKGWMLIGDAHMHLKRYKEAAGAYNDAYMLSGQAAEPRKKLKNAMYYVGLEKANGAH
jgi:cytochrome c-type biogenesis protein CcmH/NrfG